MYILKKLVLNLNLSLFCLLISILRNIVFHLSTAVICNKTFENVIYLQILLNNCYFLYNEFTETGIRLNDV